MVDSCRLLELTCQNLNLGYQWNETIGTAIGYRYFDVDYDESDFLFDVKQQGFLLSLIWSF